jgi:hypothetical protein
MGITCQYYFAGIVEDNIFVMGVLGGVGEDLLSSGS